EIGADVGADREPGRHRQAEIGHLGEARALAAQQIAQLAAALGITAAEAIHPFRFARSHVAAHPSICEKSAMYFIVLRICESRRSLFARKFRSSTLTVTLSKNSSSGRRRVAKRDMA